MLSHKNIVIFSHPRSGTKLLANILENFGYHIHGEWFSLYTTTIENNKAIRRSTYLESIYSKSESGYKKIKEHVHRCDLYKKIDNSAVTVWPESLLECPFILFELTGYHWVCLKRDPWDTMLSYYVSVKNKNFDGYHANQPFIFKEDTFRKTYWDYYKTQEMQTWIIKNRSTTVINFQDLVSGSSTAFGREYTVNSRDENVDIESLVENIDQVKEWFIKLENIRKSYISWG